MRYLGSIHERLYGASSGVIDLGGGGWQPLQIVAQADLRTNSGYEAGLLLNGASSSDIGTTFGACAATSADGAFGNQPTNDAVEVLSDTVADTSRQVTIYGTTNGTNIITAETVTLDSADGTTVKTTTKTDWGNILGIEVDSAHATAIITVREASGNAEIETIPATNTTRGVYDVPIASQSCYGLPIQVVAGAASTNVVGAVGKDPTGVTRYSNQITLAGTTAVNDIAGLWKVTKLLYGDAANGTTVTFKIGNLRYGAASDMLSDGGTSDDGDGRVFDQPDRYLHWCLVNGTTASTGGVDDALLIKLYG